MQKNDFLDKDSFYSEGEFQVTNRAKNFLATAASWGKFLAIMGFIGTGIMVIAAFGLMLMGSTIPSLASNPAFGGLGGIGVGLLYLVLAVVYVFPSLFLFKFSSKIKSSIRNSDSLEMEDGFKNLKSLFMFMGIMTIIIMVIYFLIFVVAIIAGATM